MTDERYHGVARDVRERREALAHSVSAAIEDFLKRDLGVWLTEKQRARLLDWAEQEHVG